jgi:hypothetical protein
VRLATPEALASPETPTEFVVVPGLEHSQETITPKTFLGLCSSEKQLLVPVRCPLCLAYLATKAVQLHAVPPLEEAKHCP